MYPWDVETPQRTPRRRELAELKEKLALLTGAKTATASAASGEKPAASEDRDGTTWIWDMDGYGFIWLFMWCIYVYNRKYGVCVCVCYVYYIYIYTCKYMYVWYKNTQQLIWSQGRCWVIKSRRNLVRFPIVSKWGWIAANPMAVGN